MAGVISGARTALNIRHVFREGATSAFRLRERIVARCTCR